MIDAYYNNEPFDLDSVKKAAKLKYDSSNNSYILYVPFTATAIENNNKYSFVSLDPGIRTFMTGLSENHIIKIGTNVSSKIKSYHKRLSNTNKIFSDGKRRKKEMTYRRKIKNLVDDLHWKTINYLTKTYKTILIGDMSVKGIVRKGESVLNGINKKTALSLKFYEFRQRLKYQCYTKHINYKELDERYTSKICSNCGWVNEELEGKKMFECKKCKKKIDRDINGCRGILMKIYIEE
jgi:putative transposase